MKGKMSFYYESKEWGVAILISEKNFWARKVTRNKTEHHKMIKGQNTQEDKDINLMWKSK